MNKYLFLIIKNVFFINFKTENKVNYIFLSYQHYQTELCNEKEKCTKDDQPLLYQI